MSDQWKEKREYFRIAGIIYLRGTLINNSFEKSTGNAHNDSIDYISLKLQHFRAKLSYDQNEMMDTFLELTDLLAEMHDQMHKKNAADSHFMPLKRQSVIVSGSGLEWISDISYKQNDRLLLTIGFPDYPFSILTTHFKVVKCQPHGAKSGNFLTCGAFENISEEARDLVISFVNHLQRKKRILMSDK